MRRLPLADLPATSAFTRSYIADFGRLARWYDYNPHAPHALEARLAELDAREWPGRQATADLAAAQQEQWGGDEIAVSAAMALGEPGTCMVVTGQQAGLFGGPLYTQLKALTAILLARQLGEHYPQRKFVPVFWIASADSDFEEVRRTVHAADNRDISLNVDPALDGMTLARRPVAREELRRPYTELADDLLTGLYRQDVLAALEADYLAPDAPDEGRLVRSFARWMSRLFRGTGLVIVDPEPLLAQRADIGALYAGQLLQTGAAQSAIAARDAELQEAGFTPQVGLAAGDSQLFLLDDLGYRDKLFLQGNGILAGKRSRQQWGAHELARLAQEQPGRFTGSVLLRPVIEDALFPCAAWIGGAAELAYRAQATALFALHGRRQAPAYLRHHATLLPTQLVTALDASGFDFTAVPRDVQQWRRTLAQREQGLELAAALAAYRSAAAAADSAALRLPALLPELERALRTMHGKLQWQLARTERKINAALLRRESSEIRLLEELQQLAYPRGVPQERLLGLLSFLPRTGFGLIPRLLDELSAPCWEHCLIMFD
jgi:bacillithiol biosynthesis cysteine-adding enzyme BshC